MQEMIIVGIVLAIISKGIYNAKRQKDINLFDEKTDPRDF